MSSSSPLDRTQVPAPGRQRPFHFPDISSLELANGLRVLSARLPEFPLVTAQVLAPAGGIMNPADRPGLADLHGLLLQEGTENHSNTELADILEQLGSSVDSGAGWNTAYVEVNLLSSSFDTGMELLADMVLRPSYPEDQLHRLKERAVADLLRRPSRPALLADDVFSRVLFPASPFGFALKGNRESVEAMDRDTLQTFRERCFVPAGSTLIVAGDFDPEHLARRAEELFGGWSGGEAPSLPVIESATRSGVQVHIADRPGAAQTQIQVGHVGVARGNPEFYKLLVLNVLLGGKFTSRLNLNLRERHGFTYGVQSHFTRRLVPGPFLVRTAVATEVAADAVREILFELDRVREQAIPQDELDETMSYLLGVFPYTVQTTSDVSSRLENLAIFDLPLTYYDTYQDQLRSVTPVELSDAANRFIRPEELVVVAAGPADQLTELLEGYGEIHVHRTS